LGPGAFFLSKLGFTDPVETGSRLSHYPRRLILRLSLPKGALSGFVALCLVFGVGALAPQSAIAQNAAEAQLAARVQDLESSVRDLTGQIEVLQHTVQLLQQQLQKSQDDDEFRFQQLEGGGGKKPASSARTSSTPATPAAGQKAGTADAGATAAEAQAQLVANNSAAPATDSSTQPSDGLGDSQDPLLGKGDGQSSATLGTLPATSALDLNLNSSQALSSGDAEAQYKAGYDAIVRGDYAFAEDQFRQFIQLYPKDPQAPDATNWLGEALLQRQNYDDAADILLKGYQAYQTSPRAPDLLLKLAVAMAGAGEQDVACRTFFKVGELYPKQPPAFLQKLKDEKAKAQCKV
jgi:tol-pal system protein YbgF